jgi:hypothetical protein
MDTTAHRIIHQARSLLVDRLGGCTVVARDASWEDIAAAMGHGLDAGQAQALVEITQRLYHLMVTDPAPPECQSCATPLVQAPTGRPRRFCSDVCRSVDARDRARANR